MNRIRVPLVISLPDSFRYLVMRPEKHCLRAASSVNTGRLLVTYAHVPIWITSGLPLVENLFCPSAQHIRVAAHPERRLNKFAFSNYVWRFLATAGR
jgi:hypothetical protein